MSGVRSRRGNSCGGPGRSRVDDGGRAGALRRCWDSRPSRAPPGSDPRPRRHPGLGYRPRPLLPRRVLVGRRGVLRRRRVLRPVGLLDYRTAGVRVPPELGYRPGSILGPPGSPAGARTLGPAGRRGSLRPVPGPIGHPGPAAGRRSGHAALCQQLAPGHGRPGLLCCPQHPAPAAPHLVALDRRAVLPGVATGGPGHPGVEPVAAHPVGGHRGRGGSQRHRHGRGLRQRVGPEPGLLRDRHPGSGAADRRRTGHRAGSSSSKASGHTGSDHIAGAIVHPFGVGPHRTGGGGRGRTGGGGVDLGGRWQCHRLDLPGRVHSGGPGHRGGHRLCGVGTGQPVGQGAVVAAGALCRCHLVWPLSLPLADLRHGRSRPDRPGRVAPIHCPCRPVRGGGCGVVPLLGDAGAPRGHAGVAGVGGGPVSGGWHCGPGGSGYGRGHHCRHRHPGGHHQHWRPRTPPRWRPGHISQCDLGGGGHPRPRPGAAGGRLRGQLPRVRPGSGFGHLQRGLPGRRGVRMRTAHLDHPVPRHGGIWVPGPARRTRHHSVQHTAHPLEGRCRGVPSRCRLVGRGRVRSAQSGHRWGVGAHRHPLGRRPRGPCAGRSHHGARFDRCHRRALDRPPLSPARAEQRPTMARG